MWFLPKCYHALRIQRPRWCRERRCYFSDNDNRIRYRNPERARQVSGHPWLLRWSWEHGRPVHRCCIHPKVNLERTVLACESACRVVRYLVLLHIAYTERRTSHAHQYHLAADRLPGDSEWIRCHHTSIDSSLRSWNVFQMGITHGYFDAGHWRLLHAGIHLHRISRRPVTHDAM